MNTKIYKAVHDLAERLMSTAEKDDNASFNGLYSQLQAICTEHDNTDKDHHCAVGDTGGFYRGSRSSNGAL